MSFGCSATYMKTQHINPGLCINFPAGMLNVDNYGFDFSLPICMHGTERMYEHTCNTLFMLSRDHQSRYAIDCTAAELIIKTRGQKL